MNGISAIGKFLDQPKLLEKCSKVAPTALIGAGALLTAHHTISAEDGKKEKTFIKDFCILTGTIGAALVSVNGIKKLGIKGLANKVNFEKLKKENIKTIDNFLKENKISETTAKILEKSKTKILKISEIKTIFTELQNNEKGKTFLKKLIPDPDNITSKQIFSEIKRLSIMGLMPVIGGIGGGIIGDKLTEEKWEKRIPNKIKEGSYQYLANIFLCNVGAGAALAVLEKAKVKSKSARVVGMLTGIVLAGVVGGSAIANKISQTIIDPLFSNKPKHKKCGLYEERKPEAIDLCLHTDDVATVAVLSGLKWIEPALPALYSVSGYRAGIGYRNPEKHHHHYLP